MKDERIKQVHDQIMGELGTTVFFFALAAFLAKILLLHKGLSDCVVEYVIIIGAPLFQAVRCRQMKIAFYPSRHGENLLEESADRSGSCGACLYRIWSGQPWRRLDNEASAPCGFCRGLCGNPVRAILLEKKRARKLEEEFEDE